MSKRMGFDAPKLTHDEATELCVYHLRMAAALFQLVPEDGNESLRAEITRQCSEDLESTDVLPAMTWAAMMFKAYEDMKGED
jgi:hypothetical protein